MLAYTIRRVLISIPVLIGSSILVFIITRGPGVLSLDHLVARRFLRDRNG